MKFEALDRGAVREKSLRVRLPGASDVPVLVRASSAMEDSAAIAFALAHAKARGSLAAAPGDALYDAALWAHTVSTCFLDTETRGPFFDGGADQVLSKLPLDAIAYLFQLQQEWQEEVSPTFSARSPAELVAAVRAIAERDGDVFFSRCSPYMQLILARFMAGLLATSPDTSLLDGARSVASTTTKSSAPRSARASNARPRARSTRPTTD